MSFPMSVIITIPGAFNKYQCLNKTVGYIEDGSEHNFAKKWWKSSGKSGALKVCLNYCGFKPINPWEW